MSSNIADDLIEAKATLTSLYSQFYRGELTDASQLKKQRVIIARLLTKAGQTG
jgi:ribosomal protein L29